jgi:chromosomal replication initiator protein
MAEINPKYSFENFYVYEGVRLAYTACEAVLKNKGIFNPLYIYGGEGIGKTHLLSACANYLIQKNENVFFLTPYEFYEILKNDKISKNSWIIVDDFHEFIKGGEDFQKLLIKNFEKLIAQDNELIFSSIYEIENFKEILPILKSRLLSGIEVLISPPNQEEVYKIMEFKLKRKGIEIGEELIKIIKIEGEINFRKIEGIVNKLILLNIAKRGNIDYSDINYIFKKGLYEEVVFPELKDEIEKSVSVIAERIEEAEKIKEFLEEKIYIWKMKGFEVKRLESLKNINEPEIIKKEYDRFVEDIKKLVELQKRYGEIGKTCEEIENIIFDPDKIEEIEKKLNEISKEVKEKEEILEVVEIPEIVVGEFNKEAVSLLKNIENQPAGIFLIISKGRNGVSSVLNYGFKILKRKDKIFLNPEIIGDRIAKEDAQNFSELSKYNYIFIDDFHSLLKVEEVKENLMKLLENFLKQNKKAILGSHEEIEIKIPFKKFYISPPTPDAIEKIIYLYSFNKGKGIEKEAVEKIIQRKWSDLKELTNYLDEIFSLPKEKIEISDLEIGGIKEEKGFIEEIEIFPEIIEEIIWEEL